MAAEQEVTIEVEDGLLQGLLCLDVIIRLRKLHLMRTRQPLLGQR